MVSADNTEIVGQLTCCPGPVKVALSCATEVEAARDHYRHVIQGIVPSVDAKIRGCKKCCGFLEVCSSIPRRTERIDDFGTEQIRIPENQRIDLNVGAPLSRTQKIVRDVE